MPYFFVDGIRAGANAQSLYVQAESAEAAKTRAQVLGLEPTGVRPAKSLYVPLTADAFRRYVMWMTFPIFMVVLIPMMTQLFFFPKTPTIGPFFLDVLMILQVVNFVASQVCQLMLDRDRMELELKELRQRLESLSPTD